VTAYRPKFGRGAAARASEMAKSTLRSTDKPRESRETVERADAGSLGLCTHTWGRHWRKHIAASDPATPTECHFGSVYDSATVWSGRLFPVGRPTIRPASTRSSVARDSRLMISIDNRHRWIVLIPASTLYLIHRNLVAQTNFKQPRPVLAGHKQTSAGGVVSDAVGHSFSVCAEAFDVFGRRDHARS
jgi:hypothetical protein